MNDNAAPDDESRRRCFSMDCHRLMASRGLSLDDAMVIAQSSDWRSAHPVRQVSTDEYVEWQLTSGEWR